jgi:hypothetical protein
MPQMLKCPDCGVLIPDDVDYSHCDCGCRVDDMFLDRNQMTKKPTEQIANERDAKAQQLAQRIFLVLVSKMATEHKAYMLSIVEDTCRKHGFLFAKKVTNMILADVRFADLVKIMSPAQKDGRWWTDGKPMKRALAQSHLSSEDGTE